MSPIKCFAFESIDGDEVARRVQVSGSDIAGAYCIDIITLWRPWDEPVVTRLHLSSAMMSLLQETLFRLAHTEHL